MFCRICGKKIPEDSRFCPHCGEVVVTEEAPVSAEETCGTRAFTFPDGTTYDQASVPVNEWLSSGGLRILDARYTVDTTLLAGTLVPVITRVELDWAPEERAKPYQMAVMLDSRSDFALFKRKDHRSLQRQFDQWHREHPECEVAGKQEQQLILGWSSGWITLFFYR